MALKYVFFFLTLTYFITYTKAARELVPNQTRFNHRARIDQADATVSECLNAITDIKFCGREIVDFFARGKIDHISKPCRRAIKLITRHCWPALMTALGFTAEECSMLRGYCEAVILVETNTTLT